VGQGISKYVLKYVDGCDVCQRGKNISRDAGRKINMPNPIPNAPWTDIFCGFYYGVT